MTILLDAYAARSCAVKTQNAFDPQIEKVPWEPDESLQELFDGGAAFESEVIDRLLALTTASIIDLRPLHEESLTVWEGASREAISAGIDVIVAPLLPIDYAGHRTGSPDLLVRGADRADGRPGYHPVEIKWHRVLERRAATKTPRPNSTAVITRLAAPRPTEVEQHPGLGIRVGSREADCLQLAHYHRMLEAIGAEAPGGQTAGLIGTDPLFDEPVIAWLDLAEPLVRTFSRSESTGWKLRSILERYDHEHGFRVRVAERAQQHQHEVDLPMLVLPIVTHECSRCPWWQHCEPQLNETDVSLKIEKGALDVREISVLRQHSITTITDLAGTDLDQLLPDYLPEVTHRGGAEDRIRLAARRARMLVDGVDLERIGPPGPIELPGADLEIDFDIETSPDGRVYLWGFLINDLTHGGEPTFCHFSSFDDLDADRELTLAAQALGWLRDLVAGPRSVAVFHYSDYEVSRIRQLAATGDPVTNWALDYARTGFVDLFPVIKKHYFGVRGLGLKVVATAGAGFSWRDDDPGGLNSQRWFTEAVHGESDEVRALARQRVLEYNEDDVRATAAVRSWLRSGLG